MKRKIVLFVSLVLIFSVVSVLTSCKTEEENKVDIKAVFTGITKNFEADGLSVELDSSFTITANNKYSLKCENNNLVFTAFYIEKYYFENKDVSTPSEALKYAKVGEEYGGEYYINKYGKACVEYLYDYSEDGRTDKYRMYYVCIEDEERFWFCCFYSPEIYFEEYRNNIEKYSGSLAAIYNRNETEKVMKKYGLYKVDT